MDSVILTIGDELLIGQIVDTNAAWLGEELDGLGIPVKRTITVPDRVEDIAAALGEAVRMARVVLMTGGLGPTHDDVSREAAAAHFGVPLETDAHTMAHLEAFFHRRGRKMSELGRRVALVPRGFGVIDNPIGTAPALWYRHREAQGERLLILLPGVPQEMKALMRGPVASLLTGLTGRLTVRHRTLMTAGAGETQLAARIGPLDRVLAPGVSLAYLPNPALGVRLRLTSRSESAVEAVGNLAASEGAVRERVARYVYGADGELLEGVLRRVFTASGRTLGVAESCTGGLISHRLTNVPGSSDYLRGALVTYSNESKVSLLGVDAHTLQVEGAVSEQVARQMAQGVRSRLNVTDGLAVTGIAGPGGGSESKPVGTVWIAHADDSGVAVELLRLGTDREFNKELASTLALDLVRRRVSRTPS